MSEATYRGNSGRPSDYPRSRVRHRDTWVRVRSRGVIDASGYIKKKRNSTHLFSVNDAFDIFPEDWIHEEAAAQQSHAQESLPDPHFHLSPGCRSSALSGACLWAEARTRTGSRTAEKPGASTLVFSMHVAPLDVSVRGFRIRAPGSARASPECDTATH